MTCCHREGRVCAKVVKVRPIAQTIVIQQKKNNHGHPFNVMLLSDSQREDHGGRGDTLHLWSSVNKWKGGGVQVCGCACPSCLCVSVVQVCTFSHIGIKRFYGGIQFFLNAATKTASWPIILNPPRYSLRKRRAEILKKRHPVLHCCGASPHPWPHCGVVV
jgi:hypothetical protein